MTWKSRYEIFQPRGALPSPWASYEGKNPCGKGFANNLTTLSSFSAFADFNQAGFGFQLANPLVAQNRSYVRYEVRVNQPEFDSIVGNKWYIHANLPTRTAPVPFNTGSTAIKAAWRILNQSDTPANRSRYYVVRDAQVFDVRTKKCTFQDIALVGLHIVTKTRERPQWIWSTFEHVDNVQPKTTEPKSPTGLYSFNNPDEPQMLSPAKPPFPISPKNKPERDPPPMQVVRIQDIRLETINMNRAYWNLPEIKGTVWQNYMLIMAQWPAVVAPESPTNDGGPTPLGGSALTNTIMETYFQDRSCMGCHAYSNRHGRDFVMFISLDAFRPRVLAPSDLFSAKISDGSSSAGSALSSDPMLRSLMRFLESAEQK